VSVSIAAIASTQTTILPASRTGLSMARRAALPRHFAHIHPRFRTPDVSTWWVAGISIIWYVVVGKLSENALFDTLTALSLLIAFYYSLTGIACAVYYRRHLTESAKNFVLIGLGPLIGSAMLIWLLIESVFDLADAENSYSGQAWFGLGPPLVIGIGVFLVGVVLMLVWRAQNKRFWQERPGVADPDLVHGIATARPDPLDEGAGPV
nr:APC family permease [Geodermatophilaceae bacterium]